MITCSTCQHFVKHYGEQQGFCYGTPPAMYHNGYQQVNPPTVKLNRPACHFFNALPEGVVTQVKTKADPETPGDAAKLHAKVDTAAVAVAPAVEKVQGGKRRR